MFITQSDENFALLRSAMPGRADEYMSLLRSEEELEQRKAIYISLLRSDKSYRSSKSLVKTGAGVARRGRRGYMPRTWQFDPSYTTVEFSVRRFWFFTVKGCFDRIEGVISADDSDVTQSSVTAKIKVDSLKTGNKRRDTKLRSASFLDADRFSEIQFFSTSVSRGQDRDMLDVLGALTVKGKSQPIKLSVSEMDRSRSPKGEEFVYYSATTVLDLPSLLGRQLKVTINVQAVGLATDEHG